VISNNASSLFENQMRLFVGSARPQTCRASEKNSFCYFDFIAAIGCHSAAMPVRCNCLQRSSITFAG